jgi:hypothetical protein
MNKICTSIEQSQKLIALGIDICTADMLWTYDFMVNAINGLNVISELLKPEENDIPAWSLSKLMELMPTDDKKDEYYVTTESHSDYHTVNYRNCWDGCIHSEDSEESLLDAAFEMVVWLKENGKL